jgi:phi LC3 family holin
MKINFKARMKNKAFVVGVATLLISFVYKLLAAMDIVPAVSENEILELVGLAVNVLALVGVIVDPTTDGVSDSDRAMLYYSAEVKE